MIQYTTEPKRTEDIYVLYEALNWNAYLKLDATKLAQAMEQSWLVVYAYDGDVLVGTGRIVSDGIINAYLCGLGVDEAYRKQGIGTEISKRLVNTCKKQGLHVQFFCEEHLVQYYQGQGFIQFAVGMKEASI